MQQHENAFKTSEEKEKKLEALGEKKSLFPAVVLLIQRGLRK